MTGAFHGTLPHRSRCVHVACKVLCDSVLTVGIMDHLYRSSMYVYLDVCGKTP